MSITLSGRDTKSATIIEAHRDGAKVGKLRTQSTGYAYYVVAIYDDGTFLTLVKRTNTLTTAIRAARQSGVRRVVRRTPDGLEEYR